MTTLEPRLRTTTLLLAFSIVSGICFLAERAQAESASTGPLAWPAVTREMKPGAYWWWHGSAVDSTNLTRELERHQAAGLGAAHIVPIYGTRGFEGRFIDYLSPKWMEILGHTVTEARRLGMNVDMTTGTGWCFGGPQVTDAEATARVVVKTYDVAAGASLPEKVNRQFT